MATNLLLEGQDLEALLARAHAEGGSSARIVRAQKVRRGGFLGFFAREAFEVAVEIPGTAQEADTADRSFEAVAGLRTRRADGEAIFTKVAALVREEEATVARAPAAEPAGPRPRTRGLETRDEELARERARLAAQSRASLSSELDSAEPGRLAAEGVTSAARRANAAGRVYRDSDPAPSTRLVQASTNPYAAGGASVDPADPFTTTTAAVALLERMERNGEAVEDTASQKTGLGWPLHAGPTPPTGFVPHEAPIDPVQPSTAGPAFSALLDQLRDEARPAGAAAAAARPPLQRMSSADVDRLVVAVPVVTEAPPEEAPADAPPVERASPGMHSQDRTRLQALGVPPEWTHRMCAGDRFSSVLEMMSSTPALQLEPDDAPVAVIVGRQDLLVLEAHRTALDLADDDMPRPVVVVDARPSFARDAGMTAARALDRLVAAVSLPSYDVADARHAATTASDLGAGVVIAVVDATIDAEQTAAWLQALGRVDALAVLGASNVPDPARCLSFGVPVVRLDGIPVDHVTWTALLCAHLQASGR